MQLNGLFVRVPLHLGRRIEPAAGREIHYLVYALEGKRSLSGWPAVSERSSGHLMAIAFLRRRAPCLEPPNRDRVRLHVGVRRPVVPPPPARDRRTDRRSEVRTGKEATGQRWRRRVLGRLKWPLMAARPSPSLAPTSTPTSFRSRADDRCRQRAGERVTTVGKAVGDQIGDDYVLSSSLLSLSPTQSTSLFDPFQARYP